mmetsp:Transcript_52370/g.145091  ORF Transcript_52370/g.145091 Transcript_52370/m.145091 type:complete len:151 (+) Transcript_52370:173-625(+)
MYLQGADDHRHRQATLPSEDRHARRLRVAHAYGLDAAPTGQKVLDTDDLLSSIGHDALHGTTCAGTLNLHHGPRRHRHKHRGARRLGAAGRRRPAAAANRQQTPAGARAPAPRAATAARLELARLARRPATPGARRPGPHAALHRNGWRS